MGRGARKPARPKAGARARAIFMRAAYASDEPFEAAIEACTRSIARERATPWVDRSVSGIVRVGSTQPRDDEFGLPETLTEGSSPAASAVADDTPYPP